MTGERMRTIQYSGELWDGNSVHPVLWDLLQQKDLLIEITHGEAPFLVILGVPHHARQGENRIAEDWISPKTGEAGRPADETTGLCGLAVFTALCDKGIPSKLVIAAHATDHDPNKTPGCPYWQSVFNAPQSGLLLELHGAARHRRHSLELSAGRNSIADPLIFGKLLAYFLENEISFAVQDYPGEWEATIYQDHQQKHGRLQNPALETLSLTYAGEVGLPALHLEMKSDFRKTDPAFPHYPRPTPAAWQLARAIANTLYRNTRPDEIKIRAADLGLPATAFLTRPSFDYAISFLSAMKEVDAADRMDNPDLGVESDGEAQIFIKTNQKVIYNGLPEHPPEEYLWLIDQGEFIGRVFFLHWLNEFRLKTDGQVDYWIRPSRRRQSYGTLLLRLLLERYRQLGLERILISCLTSNLGSRKIIEANGGVFESEIQTVDTFGMLRPRLRYWINIH
jgi:predicted acetyltransferase